MNPHLFKSAEFYHRRYHNFATVLIAPLVILLLFILIYGFFGQKEIIIKSTGQITPTTVIASIQSTSDQPITVNHLAENLTVSKGQVLVQYAEHLETSQKVALTTQLDRYQQQLTALGTLKDSLNQDSNHFRQTDHFGYAATFESFQRQKEDLEKGITKSNTERDKQVDITAKTAQAIKHQIDQVYDQIDDYIELYNAIVNKQKEVPAGNPHQAMLNSYLIQADNQTESTAANTYLTQIDNSIASLETNIANLNIQLASTENIHTLDDSLTTKVEALRSQFLQNANKEETEIKSQIISLQAQLKQTDYQLESQQLTAPADGILHLVNDQDSPSFAAKGTEMAKIYPKISEKSKVNISYYVSSQELPHIRQGQTVRLSLENVGNTPLILTGQVSQIANVATQTEHGNVFKIQAETTVSKKDSQRLKYGLQGRVTSVIAKKTFFNYYKDKLFNQIN